MRAPAMSIHVRAYLPKFNNEMHYYYDIIPTAVPWGLLTENIFCFGTKYDANLEIMSCPRFRLSTSPYTCTSRPEEHLESTVQNTIFARFSLVSLSIHPRSRRSAERIRQSEGRWSRPPNTALEQSDLTEKFQFRESHAEATTKTYPDQIPERRIIIYMYKGSA